MIILNNKKYVTAKFSDEAEIENVVENNYEFLIGFSSIYLPKLLIKTNGGAGTIPDGFAIDLEQRIWYMVEAELIIHSVWDHISKQVTKQMLAAKNDATKSKLQETVVEMYNSDDSIKEKFTELGIKPIDVRKVLKNIFDKDPIVGMPIDGINQDLTDWAKVLKFHVKLWVITKYVDLLNRKEVAYEFPEEFKPELDTGMFEDPGNIPDSEKTAKIRVIDLLEKGLVKTGQELYLKYKNKKYAAIVGSDGSLQVLNNSFNSPSYAAIVYIQDAGSSRKTINGWTSWETSEGILLSELRNQVTN